MLHHRSVAATSSNGFPSQFVCHSTDVSLLRPKSFCRVNPVAFSRSVHPFCPDDFYPHFVADAKITIAPIYMLLLLAVQGLSDLLNPPPSNALLGGSPTRKPGTDGTFQEAVVLKVERC